MNGSTFTFPRADIILSYICKIGLIENFKLITGVIILSIFKNRNSKCKLCKFSKTQIYSKLEKILSNAIRDRTDMLSENFLKCQQRKNRDNACQKRGKKGPPLNCNGKVAALHSLRASIQPDCPMRRGKTPLMCPSACLHHEKALESIWSFCIYHSCGP